MPQPRTPPPGTAPAPALSLASCIEIALANNPGLAVRERERNAAEARGATARAERLPTLDAVLDYRHTVNYERLLPAQSPVEAGTWARDFVRGDLVLRLPLYTGGRLTHSIDAEDLLAQSAERRLARSRQELVFNVTSLYASINAQKKIVDAVRFSRTTLSRHLERVDRMIAVERASRVDRLRTRVRLADLEQRLVREENGLDVQRRSLANLMGREGTVEILDEEPASSALPDLAAGPARAMHRRQDVLAARLEVDSLEHRVEVARSAGRPQVGITGSYGARRALGDRYSLPGADVADDTGFLGVSVELPIFEGGRISGRVTEQRERLEAARAALRSLELEVSLEVESAALGLKAARSLVVATRDAVAEADESLKIEQEKYGVGKGAIIDVLDAQTALLDAQTNAYRAVAALRVSLARYALATGEDS